ncbi:MULTISPECIES: bactofilin family protein [Roseivirga]|jgi:cytoskeletal protein CcmA (bactofilin family)|uniref:Cell shape determination protein CcmA n=2 Tax=Roseivirga TaxID=290180 RepID=A0ABQ3I6X3_9BACT|nr:MULTISPECIES: polymer-forming cytoskeletal protein [Roseivirga]MEC7753483.1 polymer-forming cytoskeletal protein [Bacteroidota bacterium]GHE62820.1 hypothetical protein GCM10011340_17630 [Roseivirga thermotolerans]|tara:strand:- start:650 stop:1042 length:393 start_codon:yes stop_codon:yes gene_type:complete
MRVNQNRNNHPTINRIDAGTHLEGHLKTNSPLVISGSFHGTISSESSVETTKGSIVLGEIKAERLIINGQWQGKAQIQGETLLESHALADGELITNKLSIRQGAQFNGLCQMQDPTATHIKQISLKQQLA